MKADIRTMVFHFSDPGADLDSSSFDRVRKTFRQFHVPMTAFLQVDSQGIGYVSELRWPDADLAPWKRAFIMRALQAADSG